MKLHQIIWALVAAAIFLPAVVAVLPQLILTAAVIFTLVIFARFVWFFTR